MIRTDKWDPRIKLILAICAFAFALFAVHPQVLTGVLLACLLCCLLAGINVGKQLVKGRIALEILGVLFFLQIFMVRSGSPFIHIGGLDIVTSAGIISGGMLLLRAMIVMLTAMFLMTSAPRDYTTGLVQWLLPYTLAFGTVEVFRMLPVFSEAAADVYYAMQLRGYDVKGAHLPGKIRFYFTLLSSAIPIAAEKYRMNGANMEYRGFKAMERRTFRKKLKMGDTDRILLVIIPLVAIGGFIADLLL